MTRSDPPEPADFSAEFELVELYRAIWLARGFDADLFLTRWAEAQRSLLSTPEALRAFDDLCARGCVAPVLAGILALLRHSNIFEEAWALTVGSKYRREATSRTLARAASVIEDAFSSLLRPSSEEERIAQSMADPGRARVSNIVSELHLFSRLFVLAETVARETETRSFLEFAKFLLAGYVKHSTGRFRDRSVSALLAELTVRPEFDEVAQRVWRQRKYARLTKHHAGLAQLLARVSAALAAKK